MRDGDSGRGEDAARSRPAASLPALRPTLPWWAIAAAAALAVLCTGVVYYNFFGVHGARRLLARAYTEQRVLEVRLPGAAYGPIEANRAAAASPFTEPLALAEAVARVAHGIADHPDDPAWLQLQGQVDLLEGREDASIVELDRAHSLRPTDAYILSDLGAAHFQEAEKNADPKHYSMAFQSFSEASRLKPNNPALLFNRAMGAERIFAYHEAHDLWETYLRVGSEDGWATEARQKLALVNEKLERQRAYAAATTPEALIAELKSGAPWDRHFAPDEEYLEVAVTRLLPAYYGVTADEGAGIILRNMAEAFIARHQDTWLRDVLKISHSLAAGNAFAALGRALEARASDDWGRSSANAGTAVRIFRMVGSEAGALRAQFEIVYALRNRDMQGECEGAGRSLEQVLRRSNFPWLHTQTLLECALCEQWAGHFGQAWAKHREAVQAATEHRYFALLLRALDFSAVWQRETGNLIGASENLMQGLALFWTARYPVLRGYSLYNDLSLLDPQVSTSYPAVAWAREALATIAPLQRPLYQAGTLHQLALTEMSVGLHELAAKHLEQTSQWLARLPNDDARLMRVIYALEQAEAEASSGEVEQPIAILEGLRGQVERSGALLTLRFNAALGRLYLRRANYAESKKLLLRALAMGEAGWATVPERDRLSWARALGDSYRALVECDVRNGVEPRKSWQLWSGYRAALFDQAPPTVPVPDSVSPDEVILSFAELPSGIAAWLGTPHGFQFRWIQPAQALHEAAGRLVRGCASARTPEEVLRADARQLSQLLLGPWDSALNGVRTVVIESDGPISALAWPALVRGNGHYWSEDFAVRMRVAAGSARSRGGTRLSDAKNVLVIGDPSINADLPPLPGARQEAEKVSSLFSRSLLLRGTTATLNEVRIRLASAEVFHFAGHGYGGDGGGLILRGAGGGPGLLTAAYIQDLNLSRCRLAVLSGCATGSGERNGPGDPQSLVRAFLRAGTQEVVASLWNLDSAATQSFMSEFYTTVFSQEPVDQSLRRAAAAVRSNSTYRHPHYWAGLQVFEVQ